MELTVDSTEDLIEKRAQQRRNAKTKLNIEDYFTWRDRLPTDVTARILAIMERYGSKSKDRCVAEKGIMDFFAPDQRPTVRSMLSRMRMEKHMSYRQRNTSNGTNRYWRMRSGFTDKSDPEQTTG